MSIRSLGTLQRMLDLFRASLLSHAAISAAYEIRFKTDSSDAYDET
jgi:hypothetical protein